MKKNLFLILGLSMVILSIGCGKDDEGAAETVDKVTADEVRLVMTMPSVITSTDVFVLAGSFKADAWTPDKSTVALTKNAAGKYTVDVKIADFDKQLEFKVVKNPKNGGDAWKFVEKDAVCAEVDNRKIALADAGKEVAFEIKNFRNTGTCPD